MTVVIALCGLTTIIGGGAIQVSQGADPARQVSLSFPSNDLSGYLHTEKLEDAYAMLVGNGIAAMVDFRKNRVLQVFAFNQFGTLQNLTYHTIRSEYYWFEGIHAFHIHSGRILRPFRPSKYSDDRSRTVSFDKARAEVSFAHTPLFSPEERLANEACTWSVRAAGTALFFDVELPDDRVGGRVTGIEGTLYPLYDRVVLDGKEQPIRYNPEPHLSRGPWVEGSAVEFIDSLGRMPRLRIAAKRGHIWFEAVTLTGQLAGAQSLIFRAGTNGSSAKVLLKLVPNPVTIAMCPVVRQGSEVRVKVMTTGPSSAPTLQLDGHSIQLKQVAEHLWQGYLRCLSVGRHELVASRGEGRSERCIWVVGDFRKATIAMGDALLKVQRLTEERWPKLEGMIPQVINRDFTPRLWLESITASTYMPRVAMILAAATLVTGQPKYVEAALRACRTYVLKSRQLAEGRVLAPAFDPDGNVPKAAADWLRPSDFGIMVRGLLVCYTALNRLKRSQDAADALDLAYEVAMGLRELQGPQGQWSPRYNYFDPRYEGGNGFVNNPHYALWRLAQVLEKVDQSKADKVRALIQDQLVSMPKLVSRQPITAGAVGGDEDIPNDPQAWASTTTVALVDYFLYHERWMALRAATCAHAGIWISDFYIDQPEHFAFPACEALLPKWAGGQLEGRGYGGMIDLVQEEARIAVAEHLSDQLAADAAAYLFADRLAWAVEPDGFVCGMQQTLPGFSYRNREYAETLNYGGVGVYALWYWQHHIASIQVGNHTGRLIRSRLKYEVTSSSGKF